MRPLLIACSALVLPACFGQSLFAGTTDGRPGVDSLSQFDDRVPSVQCEVPQLVHTMIRKLSNAELVYSLKDVLGFSANLVADLPPDTPSPEGFTNNGDFLTSSPEYAAKVMTVVESALASARTEGAASFKCASGSADSSCAQSLLSGVLKKAYRRPVSSDEVAGHLAFFEAQRTAGANFEEALSDVYERAFLSPTFLFRTASNDSQVTEGLARLSGTEYATRLAYLLWSSAPDEQLLDAATADQLADEEVLRTQITRMLKDPRAKRFTDTFLGQWLGVEKLASSVVVSRVGLSDELRQDILTEAKAFADYVLRQDKSVLDLIGANYTFVNERLAAHYGISGVTGSDFQQVSLDGTVRKGLLTSAAFLTLNAKPDESAPVGRGNRILQVITCTPPRPPNFNEEINNQLAMAQDPNMTMRERMEIHRANPVCASCHADMDPIGLGLENFDQLGLYRSIYPNGRTIDPSGTLRGVAFNTPSELSEIITSQNDYKRCIAKNLMSYAVGRSMTGADTCTLQELGNVAVQKDKTFVDLVVAIAKADQFRYNDLKN
jgi:hypothetical protein